MNFMEKIVYKITNNDSNIINDLTIGEYFPIQDNNNNKLLINKLLSNNKKLFIESEFLKVIKVENNKLLLELPSNYKNFFNILDEKCLNLLENLINNESELDTWDIEWDSQNIEYKSIVDSSSNILKINTNSNTKIKFNNKNTDITQIKEGDLVGLVLGLDYISLLIDSMIARTKLYCYFVEIHRPNHYKIEQRETINNWDFSSKIDSSNIFIKTDTNDNDNFDVKTEINKNLFCEKNNESESTLSMNTSESTEFNMYSNEKDNINPIIITNESNISNYDLVTSISSNSNISRVFEQKILSDNDNDNDNDYLVLGQILNTSNQTNEINTKNILTEPEIKIISKPSIKNNKKITKVKTTVQTKSEKQIKPEKITRGKKNQEEKIETENYVKTPPVKRQQRKKITQVI